MNPPELNAETIKQRIRQEAMRRKAILCGEKSEQGTERIRPQESFPAPETKETWIWRFVKKVQRKLQKIPFYQSLHSLAVKFKGFIPKQYEFVNLSDLLPYQDEDFIRNAYRAILRREPDTEGFNDWLSSLRSGEFNKIEILGGIARSKEGRHTNVKVKGLRIRYLANRSYKIPIAGYFIRLLTAIINLPKITRTLYGYQAFTDARLTDKADRKEVEELRPVLSNKADRESVEELTTTTQDISRKVSEHRLNILDQQRRFVLLLEELRKRFPEPLSHEQIKNILKEEDHILDPMYMAYMAFEDRYRGTRDEIKRKLSVYLPYLDKIRSEKRDISILDLGCGRGDWLELLRENGYRAKGVDINNVALLQCREQGLDVIESDAIEYLKGLEKGFLDVISGFHLIEHLSFKTLIELFDQALRVLKSGGMILFETPNPTNIFVSFYDFYRDPSHQKPFHPDTLNFIAESRGFIRTGSYFVLDEGKDLKLIKSTEWKLNDINDYIKAPRDFALIGYKP